MEAYEDLKNDRRAEEMLAVLKEEHRKAEEKGHANRNFQIYRSPQSNGFYFNAGTGFSTEEFRFLLTLFGEITASLGYTVQTSDRKMTEVETGVRTTERIYLKPSLGTSFEPPIDQRYGNVHLELVLINDAPSYLKVMAHVYMDRNYRAPGSFDEFTGLLLSGGVS